MKRRTCRFDCRSTALVMCISTLMIGGTVDADAQPAPAPHYVLQQWSGSGAQVNPTAEMAVLFHDRIEVAGAPWLRLRFGDFRLGARSFVLLRSPRDGHVQRLSAETMAAWAGNSAFFNGDTIEVELHVAANEKNIAVEIQEITVGEWVGGAGVATSGPVIDQSLCGPDDRIADTLASVGRVMPNGCTGWIISNGAHLTAGHCVNVNQVLQFNIPPSECDGTVQHPPPLDQFPIAYTDSFNDGFGAIGDDWAVFEAGPNDENERPIDRQRAFLRTSRDADPPVIRITGCGVDNTPRGCSNGRNSDNQTLQTNAGNYLGESISNPSDVFLEYTTDTNGGNSGSPILAEDAELRDHYALGIHTNAGCSPPNRGNTGTGFEHDNLEAAIQRYPLVVSWPEYAGVVYTDADPAHPNLADGTVHRPFTSVADAVNAVPSGATRVISIVAGEYPASAGNTFVAGLDGRVMVLDAPVGPVVIGN